MEIIIYYELIADQHRLIFKSEIGNLYYLLDEEGCTPPFLGIKLDKSDVQRLITYLQKSIGEV